MKKIINSIISALMVVLMVFSSVSVASAAGLARVQTPEASKRTDTTVSVKWAKVSGASGYELYRAPATGTSWKKVATISATSYNVTSLSAGTKYRFRVRAYKNNSKSKEYGRYSPTLTTATLPATVKNLKVSSSSDTSITLKWSKASGAKGYEVYMLNSAGKYVKYSSTTSTSATVKGLTANKKYSFKVRAYHALLSSNSVGSYSSVVSATTKSAKVTGFKLQSATENSCKLIWNAASGVSGYQIARYDNAQSKWVVTKDTTATSYTVSIKPNTFVKYKIRSYKVINGAKNYSAYSSVVTASAIPAAPKGLECSANSGSGISIKWNAVTNASGYEISSYHAENGTWQVLATTTKTSYTVENLTETSTYKYRVRAYVGPANSPSYGPYCESVSVFYQTNKKPDSIYTEKLEASGVFGYLYDPKENCFYTSSDPWQRVAGYNSIYDVCAPMALIYIDSTRFIFDYKEKEWMIEAWKGQYGLVFYGAEVGVYNKPDSRILKHYDCASDEDMLMMSFDFYEKKTNLLTGTTWRKQFSRPYGLYWWCTGFIPGNRVGRFDNLRVDVRITTKDYSMLSAFTKAIAKEGVKYSTNGLNVYFSY